MAKFKEFLEKELNIPQKKAVSHKKGPLIVIAGAGSGKTRVITARMTNLILEEKTGPASIVALTFTNKAAKEMKERLFKFIYERNSIPFVGTFHSYCLLLLRKNPTLLKHPQFSILDADDQKSMIKKIIKKYGLEKQLSANEAQYQISNFKNRLDPNFQTISTTMLKEIYLEYEAEKSAAHSLDFDDLMLEVLSLFKKNKEFKESFQEKVRHILVDEYQDTNIVQHELLKQMATNGKKTFCLESLCVVGDEDQSIYSWRGAVATNMQQFQEDFAPTELIKIEQNYRTVQPILDAANKLIENNMSRKNKKLWSNKKAKDRILSVNCRSGRQESDAIANFISCLSNKKKLSQIAILYRTHYQSRTIEEALIYNSIAYKIVGGIRFYERKEIKDLLAYLRLVINPFDRVSFFRIINFPTRGLGAKFEETIYEEWKKNPLLDFKQLISYILESNQIKLSITKKDSLIKFLDIYKNLSKNLTPTEIAEYILDQTNVLNFLKKSLDEKEFETKTENIREFVQSIYNFENENQGSSLEDFLQEIALMQEKIDDKENKENQVQCMTLHAAKGLEFDTVIISGLEEGVLPSFRSLNTNKELEEERRLFYVGMTRAKERLLIFRANCRHSYGQINDLVASRFLTEIPDSFLNSIDISEKYEPQIRSYFKNWLDVKSQSILTFQEFAKSIKFVPKNQTKLKNKSPRSKSLSSTWKKNQLVNHKKFGIGVVKKVEKRNSSSYYLTIIFKVGEKKVLSSFVSRT